MFTLIALCVLTLAACPSVAAEPDEKTTIASIDLFGYGQLDVTKLRLAVPIKTGESIKISDWNTHRTKIEEAIQSLTGKPPTDVALLCCNEGGDSVIYVGVAGGSSVVVQHKPAPTGTSRLPEPALKLNREIDEASQKAALAGHAQQDISNGYALSADPELRARELQMREFALSNEAMLRNVLASSSDAEHRAIAAQFLGYVNVSKRQIADLLGGARDPDPGVRNNAVRALGVIAASSPQRANMIPGGRFIPLLKSGKWVDRNKGGWLLTHLTASRDPALLVHIRIQALDALIEMARWKFAVMPLRHEGCWDVSPESRRQSWTISTKATLRRSLLPPGNEKGGQL